MFEELMFRQVIPLLSYDELLNKFIEDEDYYINVGNPHFSFIQDLLHNETFKKEIQLYIDREQSNAYKLHIKKFTGEIVGIFIFLFTGLHTIRCARKKRWKCEEIEGFY